jgi:hypothetical protein
MEQVWNGGLGDMAILPLGRLTAIRGERSPRQSEGEVSLSTFNDLKVWSALGVLKISEVRELSREFTGWGDFWQLSQNAVQARFASSEGPKAGAFRCTERERRLVGNRWGQLNYLCVPGGTGKIERIVQNELLSIRADYYRVVRGTHTWTLPPIRVEYLDFIREEQTPARKFRAVLRFDPFDSVWVVFAFDIAGRYQEFSTDHVGTYLRSR